jgi:aspartate 1-decarboxylase
MDKMRKVLHAKIHGATVTHADLRYEGSITIPPSLLKASHMAPFEAVNVWDVTNGSRFETYIIAGKEEGVISVNGAAARLVQPGDNVIVASFSHIPEQSLEGYEPTVVFVDENNSIKSVRQEIAGPALIDKENLN